MGMRLFIAEKPSVAMEFAKALGMNTGKRSDGYIEDGSNIVTWCVGHLITMCYPDKYDPDLKNWKMETLPFIPEKYKYEVISNVAKQYKVVSSLLTRKDLSEIYYAGDSAREGEYIQRLVRARAGHYAGAKEFRVWIDSQTKEEILNGIKNAKPLSYYDNMSDAAYARAIEDYLIGINFSRTLSLKYANLVSGAVGGKYQPIAVGRVMSCVLGLIVERERLIRSTKSIPYFGIKADMPCDLTADWKIIKDSKYFSSVDCYKDTGMLKKELTEDLIKELNKNGTLTIVDKKDSTDTKNAPLLFNLAELQGECTRLFHISPKETLDVAQSLYEKKLTTYPRTDARVLTTAVCKVYDTNINGLKKITEVMPFADEVITNNWQDRLRKVKTKYVDDSQVSDHYAIIPTGVGMESLGSLSPLEKDVYLLICKRFLSIFYPSCVYDKLSVTYMQGKECFIANYSAVKTEGYLKVTGHKNDTDIVTAIKYIRGLNGTIQANFSIKEGASQPPKRYNSGSIILAMESAGNLIDDPELREQIKGCGIGTSATRAETISKLERIGYIKINKKTQIVQPDKMGELVYDVLHIALAPILNPKYTASWETGLSAVEKGEITKDVYLSKIYKYVESGVSNMKKADYANDIRNAISSLKSIYPDINTSGASAGEVSANCPACGKPMRYNEKSLYCTGYKDGCTFSIWKEVAKKKLPNSILEFLCTTTKELSEMPYNYKSDVTKEISGFKSKAGKDFKAKLSLTYAKDDRVKIEFIFK